MKFAIKEKREEIGISQEQLAEKADISRATLSKLETNSVDYCNSKTLIKIADALNLPVSHLFVES